MSNNEEAKELTISEIRDNLASFSKELNDALEDIEYSKKRLAELSSRDYNEKIDVEKDIRDDKNIIYNVKPIIAKLKALLCELLVREILADREPELTTDEAQMLMDMYVPIVDENTRNMEYDKRTYEAFGKSGNLEGDDEFNAYDEAFSEFKDSTTRYENSLKVLNYAQCFIPENKQI